MREAKRQDLHKLPDQGKTVTLPIDLEAIYRACTEANDSTELMHWYLVELSALFESIKAVENNQYSTLTRLAELGKYLCEDWANTADCAKADAARHADVLCAMLHPKGEKHV